MAKARKTRPAGKAGRKTKTTAGSGRKEERRTAILEAARGVFARQGYHRATVEDIVGAAGVARGTFYLYFDDKRAVFAELVDRFWSRLTVAIVRIVTDDAERPVRDQVRENIRGVVAVCLAEREMTKILLGDVVGNDASYDRKLLTFYDEVVQLLAHSLRDGQTRGIVRDGEPRVLAYLAIGAVKELMYQMVTLGLREESAEVVTEQVYEFLRGGFLNV